MKTSLSRRDFLKLGLLAPLAARLTLRPVGGTLDRLQIPQGDNVLVLLFDTLSALHVSLYGYPRETMPNLARFAERATVYHAHYSAGNFTPPGTASILTGTYPWTHRAFLHHATVLARLADHNLFSAFDAQRYTRIAFSHNLLVNILLSPFQASIDEFTLPNEIALADFNLADNLFPNDYALASQVERRYLKKPGKLSNSLYLRILYWLTSTYLGRRIQDQHKREYPRGLPGFHDLLYPLEDTIDWLMDQSRAWPQPYLSYVHLMPPHNPYLPSRAFNKRFWDDLDEPRKPEHFFSEGVSRAKLREQRTFYDQYIAYVDAEFGRLFDFLDANGTLDRTWVVFTSDHGEMFERGIQQHTTPTLYQSLIRVPLLISQPGQASRQDVHANTSCVDLLPTLLHVTGQEIPSWCEGEVLPPFSGRELDPQRSLYVVEAKTNPKSAPLTKATLAVIKGRYKLIWYFGYPGFDGVYELYDLVDDPDELNDLYDSQRAVADALAEDLRRKVREADARLSSG